MKRFFVILMALCSTLCVNAQEILTLEQCREMALENNKSAAVARLQSEKAQYTLNEIRSNFFPNISASGLALASNISRDFAIEGGYLPTFVPNPATGELSPNVMTMGGVPITDANGNYIFNEYAYFPGINYNLKFNTAFNASILVKQPVYMGGKIIAGYRMAKLGTELSGLNEKLSNDEVVLKSDEAYWNCVKAKAMISALKQYYSTLEGFCKDMQNAVEVGMKTSNELLKVQVQLNTAELNLLKAENALKLATMNLCHVIGLPLNKQVDVADNDLSIEIANYGDFDVTERIEYEMLTKQVEMQEEQIKVIAADYLPNIALVGAYGYTNGFKLNDERFIDNDSFAGLVTISIPIFHWGEGKNKISAARADSKILQMQRSENTELMELEINQALNALSEAQMEVEFAERSLEQTKENLRITQDNYEVGRETVSELLEAQTLWQKALTDKVTAEASLRLAWTKYLKTIGRLQQE